MKKLSIILLALLFAAAEVHGQDWVPTNGPGGVFSSILFNNNKDIFVLEGTLIRSTDHGSTWKQTVPKDLEWTPGKVVIAPNQEIYLLGSSQSGITYLWNSTDNGDSWISVIADSINNFFIGPDNTIYVCKGKNIDSIYSPLFRSEDLGKTWDTLKIPTNVLWVNAEPDGVDSIGAIFLSTLPQFHGLYRSKDKGSSWKEVFMNDTLRITYIASTKKDIFFSTNSAIYHSSDNGDSWLSLPYKGGRLAVSRSGRVLSSEQRGVIYTDDFGKTWKNYYSVEGNIINSIARDADSGFYFWVGDSNRTYHSGSPTTPLEFVNFPTSLVGALLSCVDGTILAADGSSLWSLDSASSLWRFIGMMEGSHLVMDSNKYIFLIGGHNIYRSIDTAKHWEISHNSEPITCAVVYPNGAIYLGTVDRVIKSINHGLSWDPVGNISQGVTDLIVSHDGIIYGVPYSILQDSAKIIRSEDSGKTWKSLTVVEVKRNVGSIITDRYGNIFAAISFESGSKIYRSTDKGLTWSEFDNGLTVCCIGSMIELPNGAIALSAPYSGVFILDLGECEWKLYTEGLPLHYSDNIACNSNGVIYTGTYECGVYKSTHAFAGIPNLSGYIDPGSINFGSTSINMTQCENVFVKNKGFAPFTINSYTVIDPNPFSVSHLSQQLPITLEPNDSFSATICFHPHQRAVYSSSIIWNTDIDSVLCGISRETSLHGIAIENNAVPVKSQNQNFSIHPNPIRSIAQIHFSLSKESLVKIECFDMLGRSRRIVGEGNYNAGDNSISWDSSDLPEGAYIIECTIGSLRESQSVIVVH